MEIRTATIQDLDAVTALEAVCFPPAEAAGKESFQTRLETFGDYFWLLFDGDTLVSMVNGMVTNLPDLADEMYHDAGMHDPKGKWQMIFGVDTRPEYQRKGYAGQVLNRAIADAKEQGRAGLVLTCKDALVHYYAKFGFEDEGISESSHGGVVWHQMRLTF